MSTKVLMSLIQDSPATVVDSPINRIQFAEVVDHASTELTAMAHSLKEMQKDNSEMKNTMDLMLQKLNTIELDLSPDFRHQVPVLNSESSLRNNDVDRRDKLLKHVDFPVFAGSNLYGWIARVERYTRIAQFTESQLFDQVSVSLSDDALGWFNWEINRAPFLSWKNFKDRILLRFGSLHVKGPSHSLFCNKQSVSVDDCVRHVAIPESCIETSTVPETSIVQPSSPSPYPETQLHVLDVSTVVDCCEKSTVVKLRHVARQRFERMFHRVHSVQQTRKKGRGTKSRKYKFKHAERKIRTCHNHDWFNTCTSEVIRRKHTFMNLQIPKTNLFTDKNVATPIVEDVQEGTWFFTVVQPDIHHKSSSWEESIVVAVITHDPHLWHCWKKKIGTMLDMSAFSLLCLVNFQLRKWNSLLHLLSEPTAEENGNASRPEFTAASAIERFSQPCVKHPKCAAKMLWVLTHDNEIDIDAHSEIQVVFELILKWYNVWEDCTKINTKLQLQFRWGNFVKHWLLQVLLHHRSQGELIYGGYKLVVTLWSAPLWHIKLGKNWWFKFRSISKSLNFRKWQHCTEGLSCILVNIQFSLQLRVSGLGEDFTYGILLSKSPIQPHDVSEAIKEIHYLVEQFDEFMRLFACDREIEATTAIQAVFEQNIHHQTIGENFIEDQNMFKKLQRVYKAAKKQNLHLHGAPTVHKISVFAVITGLCRELVVNFQLHMELRVSRLVADSIYDVLLSTSPIQTHDVYEANEDIQLLVEQLNEGEPYDILVGIRTAYYCLKFHERETFKSHQSTTTKDKPWLLQVLFQQSTQPYSVWESYSFDDGKFITWSRFSFRFCTPYYFAVWHCWRHKTLQNIGLFSLQLMQQEDTIENWWLHNGRDLQGVTQHTWTMGLPVHEPSWESVDVLKHQFTELKLEVKLSFNGGGIDKLVNGLTHVWGNNEVKEIARVRLIEKQTHAWISHVRLKSKSED